VVLAAVVAVMSSTSALSSGPHSLRFFGNGVDQIDRVKIRIDDPTDSQPGPPADIGATSFTIELWLKTSSGNSATSIDCGWNINWINGNIAVDRDRYGQGRKFGLSMGAGVIAWGVTNGSGTSRTVCGDTDLRDGAWHHVAVQRRRSDGMLWIWVDGALEARADGPNGDVSYPDDGVPGDYCGGPCTASDPFIVIGAEKHDAGSSYPSYHGWIDEIRLSTRLRYASAFTPPADPFDVDGATAALYHLNKGSGNTIHDARGPSDGVRKFGGNPAGPRWTSATPF
jgi:hypothetical protein